MNKLNSHSLSIYKNRKRFSPAIQNHVYRFVDILRGILNLGYDFYSLLNQGLQNTNSHKIPRRHLKQRNQLDLSHQDDCKTRKDNRYCIKTNPINKQRANTEPPQTIGTAINNETTIIKPQS